MPVQQEWSDPANIQESTSVTYQTNQFMPKKKNTMNQNKSNNYDWQNGMEDDKLLCCPDRVQRRFYETK